MSTETSLETIASLSPTIAAENAASEQAYVARIEAETALLERAVSLVLPALKGISTRPVVHNRCWWPTNVETASRSTRAEWRGLLVAGDAEPERDCPRANDGESNGCGLYLRADGTWCELTHSGYWSNWQGASSEWTAKEKTLTSAQVAAEYDAPDIIASIADALTAAKGKRTEPTKKQLARAEQFRAIVALTTGGK